MEAALGELDTLPGFSVCPEWMDCYVADGVVFWRPLENLCRRGIVGLLTDPSMRVYMETFRASSCSHRSDSKILPG